MMRRIFSVQFKTYVSKYDTIWVRDTHVNATTKSVSIEFRFRNMKHDQNRGISTELLIFDRVVDGCHNSRVSDIHLKTTDVFLVT